MKLLNCKNIVGPSGTFFLVSIRRGLGGRSGPHISKQIGGVLFLKIRNTFHTVVVHFQLCSKDFCPAL